jgi:hypothetical protein
METNGWSCERVRSEILGAHERVRAAVAEVSAATSREELVTATQAVLDLLMMQLQREDELLAPLLRDVDAWGQERERRLQREHAERRADVERLRAVLTQPATGPRTPLAAVVRHFVDGLLADMGEEERDLLSPELLRDDAVRVDFGG